MKIAVLDLETTGFNPLDCIVEIGVCALDLKTDLVEKLLDMPVREGHFSETEHGGSWVFQNTTLKVVDVTTARPWSEVEHLLLPILKHHHLTAFNKAFDFSFLRARNIIPLNQVPCPMVEAAKVLKIPGPYGDYKWPTLEEAWSHYFPGLGYIEQHRAYDDAVHEAHLIREMHRVGDFPLE